MNAAHIAITTGAAEHTKPGTLARSDGLPTGELLHATEPAKMGSIFTARMEAFDTGPQFLLHVEWCPRVPGPFDSRLTNKSRIRRLHEDFMAEMLAKWGHRYAEGGPDAATA
jgi:hypothetical protein